MGTRLKSHISNAKQGIDTKFYRAIRKYGVENFNSTILVNNVPDYFINSFEKYWINFYNSFLNGYNSTEGGDGISNPSKEIIEKGKITKNNWSLQKKTEYKNKISKSITELWINPTYREIQSSKKLGKKHTTTQKKKISIALKGKPKPEGFRIGSKHSNETKKKLSDAKKGLKNPYLKPVTIYDSYNIPKVTILTKFKEVCKELGYPTSLQYTYKNNSKLYEHSMRKCDISKLTNEGKYQYKGWYARYSK